MRFSSRCEEVLAGLNEDEPVLAMRGDHRRRVPMLAPMSIIVQSGYFSETYFAVIPMHRSR